MNPSTQVLLSCALTFGVPILLAGWELWRLGPSPRHLPPGGETSAPPPPLPDPVTAPRGQKPLPDCLIPRLPSCPAGTRELEEVQ